MESSISTYLQKFSREKNFSNYVSRTNLTDSMDALVAGLVVIRPHDPLTWCINSLRTLADMPDYSITWDCLIPLEMRPKLKPGQRAIGYLDEIFRLDTQREIPDPKMFEKAYNHYYLALKTKAWKAWVEYRLYKIRKHELFQKRCHEARAYYSYRNKREIIKFWKTWTRHRISTCQEAENKLRHVYESYFQTSIMENWLEAAKESKTTRIYFEQLEKGEGSSLNAEELEHLGIDLYKDPISMLDRSVALKIFARLNLVDLATCSQVCRAWKVLTNAPSLWAKLDFYVCRHRFNRNDAAVSCLIGKNHPYLIHLNLQAQYNLNPNTLKTIGKCSNLQDLNLSECHGVTDTVILTIVSGCTGLLYLNLSSTSITDNCLRDVGKYCVSLRKLNISNCQKFTDRGLHSLAMGKGGKKLIYLDISKCPQITIQGYYSIAKGFPCLETFKLFLNYTVSDQAVIQSVQKLTNLTEIDLMKCVDLTDQSIKYLAECRTLTKISLERQHKIGDGALRALAKYCPNLNDIVIIDCARITDATLKALGHLDSLKNLNIADCSRISDAGMKNLTDGKSVDLGGFQGWAV